MIKIAVDAMGSDHAPGVEVEGAVQAASQLGVPIVLVGQEALVRPLLAKHDASNLPIEIVHASEVVTMEDSASTAVRRKKDSSIRVCETLMRDGKVSGVVSAGNTGAVMATASITTTAAPTSWRWTCRRQRPRRCPSRWCSRNCRLRRLLEGRSMSCLTGFR